MELLRWQVGDATIIRIAEVDATAALQGLVWHVWRVLPDHAMTIARAYGLGAPASEMIMAARGEQGCLWRLDTETGTF
jgi:hypothetical protein